MNHSYINQRYSRQILFNRLGLDGQKRLAESAVIIIGCGALGTVIANNLIRLGVGRIKIVDRDYVELENLHRGTLFDETDVQKRLPKAVAAVEKLKKVNSNVQLEADVCDLNARNIEQVTKDYKLIIDAMDNLETRFLVNDFCIKNNLSWIYGAVLSSFGMTMNIIPGKTACFRCFAAELPRPGTFPTCETAGIINPVPHLIASLQTVEAIKILIGAMEISQALTYVDLWNGTFKQIKLTPKEDCPTCTQRNFEFLMGKKLSQTVALCGRNAIQISPPEEKTIFLEELKRRLEPLGEVFYNGFLLNFNIDNYEMVIFPNGRVMVKGTSDETIARSLYAKYIGI